jgi:hypothetical protein
LLVAFAQGNDALSKLVHAIFGDCGGAEPALLEAQRELLSGYDVTNISRIATICHWGRSGSVLIASFLDGHDDVLILPNQLSESIYPFLGRYASLTLWQKLLAYPAYSRQQKTPSGEFFLTIDPHCDYAITPADYLVAVMALHREYGDFPPEVLGSDAAFFRFLHVAYALVLGRRAGNPRPIMVVAQHWWNEQLAARLCGDFPGALFLHTIRDPISAFDAWLDMHFQWQLGGDAALSRGYPYPVFDAWRDLLSWDHAHRGVAARSRAVRFEDMHNEPEALMQRVARWLQIGVQPSLVESTLNGKPYVVMIKGQAVVGSDPQRAGRRAGNLSALDRLLIFALLHHNFVEAVSVAAGHAFHAAAGPDHSGRQRRAEPQGDRQHPAAAPPPVPAGTAGGASGLCRRHLGRHCDPARSHHGAAPAGRGEPAVGEPSIAGSGVMSSARGECGPVEESSRRDA